ncbi:MAG: serine/threonine-protein kinase [Pyrinomonadaceae bacterium]
MKICSVCHRCYADETANCDENHGVLIAEPQTSREMVANFRLDALLERDAVGESFLATHTALDQVFVIKIINQNFISNAGEQARRQLERDARAVVNLKHPNIARVYEFGTLDNGGFYTVREFPGGQSLQESLRNAGSFSESEAVTIAEKSAEALIAAHDAGIIHRAVSPTNIILGRDEENKISVKLQNFDFGGIREKTIAADANYDAVVEMLRYLSPEQCGGQTSDAETDVYSLGIVLYEMLCGRSPFVAPTSAAISERKIDEQPLSELRFETRALFAHTINQALQVRPEARLNTGNFARQLRHIAQVLSHLGDVYAETSHLPLPHILSSNSNKFDESEFFNSAPVLEAAELNAGLNNDDRPQFETAAPIKLETATALTNPVIEQSAEENLENNAPENTTDEIEENTAGEIFPIIESAQIYFTKEQTDSDSLKSAPIPADNQTAEKSLLTSEPIFAEENRTVETSFKTENLKNETWFAPGNLKFDGNQPDENRSNEISSDEIHTFDEPIFVEKNRIDENAPDEILSFDTPIFIEEKQSVEDSFESKSAFSEATLPTSTKSAFDEPIFNEPPPIFVGKNQSVENPFDDGDSEPIRVIRSKPNVVIVAPEISASAREIVEPAQKTEIAAPNFMNYADENRPRRRVLPANRSALVGIGLLGLLIVSIALGAFLYNRNQQEQPIISEATPAAAPPQSQTISETNSETAEINQSAEPETKTSATSAPRAAEKTSSPVLEKRVEQKPPAESAKSVAPIREQTAKSQPPDEANGKPRTELNDAFNELISATNSGNVERQMNYYAPKLDAYYLSRNASQSAVRAEKKRVFSRADAVDIQAGKPDIKLSPDGRKATMRFRKKYAIKQGQKNRSGEVVQELQWVKSGDGWRIVSERDVKIINP